MSDTRYLDWPFFEPRHRALAARAGRLGQRAHLRRTRTARRRRAHAARWCARWAQAGWLRHAVAGAPTAARPTCIDTRALCLLRETLARHAAWPTSPSRCRAWARARSRCRHAGAEGALPAARGARRGDRRLRAVRARGRLRRGGDATARRARDGDGYVLDGEKTWISNGGIADFYVRLRAHRRGARARAASRAFVVDADTPGLRDRRAHRRHRAAPAGAAALRRLPRAARRSASATPGEGFKVAMRTLDMFRASVAAAALGFARRALDEALQRAQPRARCSAARWPTSSSRRPSSPTWRPPSTAPRC